MSETTHPVARTFSLVGFDQTAGPQPPWCASPSVRRRGRAGVYANLVDEGVRFVAPPDVHRWRE